MSPKKYDVYLEIGEKRIFAGSVAWPGWCRSGRDEESALQALFDSGPRYAKIVKPAGLGYEAPENISSFNIVERLEGNRTTDFGAPDMPVSSDKEPVEADELERFKTLLKSYWSAFDQAIKDANGKKLRKGPRGGGRDLEKIIGHVIGADESYLKQIGWKIEDFQETDSDERLARIRDEILQGFTAAARGKLPTEGPRGGKRWSPRYFVRRVAWHVIDHAWEIEDRIL
ncbi:MAG: hypothetical protein PVJ21_17115 [Anaerolineales bacterium]|jgi:hypothetical protein